MKTRIRLSAFPMQRAWPLLLPLFLGGAAECPSDIDADGDGYSVGAGDCDDTDPTVHPDAVELCDGLDNDCDRLVDEGATTVYYLDQDGDGYGTAENAVEACAPPLGYAGESGDCDDTDPTVHPNATEACNGIDDNCNGEVDESLLTAYYADADGDGYGDPATQTWACDPPAGTVSNGDDCDDGDPAINPGAEEILCNGLDDDCDGIVEDPPPITYHADADGDGYGDPAVSMDQACGVPDGYVLDDSDCDDGDAGVYPGAVEVCNQRDDNCNGQVDEGLPEESYYQDLDGDGWGSSVSVTGCTMPDGYVLLLGDCDDLDPGIHPEAEEVCGDGVDQDCDGVDPDCPPADEDGDGFPAGEDCDDRDSTVYPGAEEVCGDGVDQDCDGADQACPCVDEDGDGRCADEDCDDQDPTAYPGAEEVCGDQVDNDCDGEVDETARTYYLDSDGDGYGVTSETVLTCQEFPPEGYTDTPGDCDDRMTTINPDGVELCNGLDDDCDGLVDTEDTWGDNTTGELASLNDNCDTFDRLLGGENRETHAVFWAAFYGDGENTFPTPIWVGGHTPGAVPPPENGWPDTCLYYDLTLFYGNSELNSDLDTRAIKLCFSKGTDVDGQDEVYAEMTAQGITVAGVLDNEEDDDAPGLDSVYFSPSESDDRYEVWYISDSFEATGGRGPTEWWILTEFYDARIVLDLQPGT